VSAPWKPATDRAEIVVRRSGQVEEVVATANGGSVFALETHHLAAVIAGESKQLIPAQNAVGNALVLDTIWRRMHG
jgi:hypothetical protein